MHQRVSAPPFIIDSVHPLRDPDGVHYWFAPWTKNRVRLEEVTVRVGEWDVSNLEEVKPHQDLDVKEFLPHPGYKPGAAADDYALLITKKRINFDYHVSPVCLPNPIDRFEGQRCIATGWDISVASTGAPALEPRLKKSSLSIIGNSECQRRLSSSDSTIKLARNTICTAKEANGSCLVSTDCIGIYYANYINGNLFKNFVTGRPWRAISL